MDKEMTFSFPKGTVWRAGETYPLPDLDYEQGYTVTRDDLPQGPVTFTFELSMDLTEEGREFFEKLRTIYYMASPYAVKGKTCQLPGSDWYIVHLDDVEELTRRAQSDGYRFVAMTPEMWDREMERLVESASSELTGKKLHAENH